MLMLRATHLLVDMSLLPFPTRCESFSGVGGRTIPEDLAFRPQLPRTWPL